MSKPERMTKSEIRKAASLADLAFRHSSFGIRHSPFKTASILVGLLWCVALLSLVVIGGLHTSRLQLMIGKNYSDRIQARYLALAGIEKAKALLFQDAIERRRGAKNHTGDLYDSPDQFREIDFGPGKFTVF